MRRIILMGFPLHNNLGDHAIAMAEEKFIKENFPEYEYYCVPEGTMLDCVDKVRKSCTDDDILFLHGGGNFGNQYMYIEESRRKILKLFPNNKIILMPQSIYFSDDKIGQEEFRKSIECYNNHKNLTLIAREEVSYNKMKNNFKADILFTPDIVMSLNKQDTSIKRNGIMYVLRNDVEKVLSDENKNNIINIGKKYFNDVKITDMMYKKDMKVHHRNDILDSFMNEFKERKVVVTDRLHGMIFCAITGTPCIAFSNYNHKVKSSFEWLKHLNYIKFLDDTSKFEDALMELTEIKHTEYDNTNIMENLNIIVNKVKNF